MRLRDLLSYDHIVIQCHDNPDADAIASGYAVYLYLQKHGKKPLLVYGGANRICKTSLVMMVEDLHIPIRHVEGLDTPELLVLVDCQYEGGNVQVFPAGELAVIDHHRISTRLPKLGMVRPNIGSCSTLLYKLLRDEGIDVKHNRELSTALYYGLFTDTGGFAEVVHPLDRDLRDEAGFDPALMTKYRNAILSLEDLEVMATALRGRDYLEEYRAALVQTGNCDPNTLGIINDLMLEVDVVDVCVVFNRQPHGIKLSVRTCIDAVSANELAAELCEGIGTGGGHVTKAGGFIQMDLLAQEYEIFCEKHKLVPQMMHLDDGRKEPAMDGIKSVLRQRFINYMENTKSIYEKDCNLDQTNARTYCRKMLPWGYVRAREVFPVGTPVTVRTMQGDVDTVIRKDMVIAIGPKGGAFFRQEEDFNRQYRTYPDWNYVLQNVEYEPTLKNRDSGVVRSLIPLAKVCVPMGKKRFYAKQLDLNIRLFHEYDNGRQYTMGQRGDYLVETFDEVSRVHVMKKDLFEYAYRSSTEKETQKAVIFDLDGTLLYTLEDLKNAVNAALTRWNMPVCSLEQVRQYVGNGVRKLMERAVPQGTENPEFEQVFDSFKDYYSRHCLDHTRPYSDIMNLLQELRARGIKIAIVSNKLDSAVKELNERFFSDYISVAIGEMEGVAKKPAPDMVEKALRELGMEKGQAVYVGDSDVDIQTAANSGLPCISVTWGFRDEKFLRENGAVKLVKTPLELLYLL